MGEKTFQIDYQQELNPEQYQAVITDGPLLVIAGAGSGKTRTIIYKVAYLIENGVNPQSIVLMTFTRKAAYEMSRRASSILDDRCSKVAGGTFHSFGAMMLRKYGEQIGYSPNFTILDNQDAQDVIVIVKNQLKINKKTERFPRKDTILDIISKSINSNKKIEDIILNDYPHFYDNIDELEEIKKRYGIYKKEKNIMDYDDLLVNLRELLDIDEIRVKLSNRYKYIMIDEYQDTNRIQAQIACYLASEHGNIMAVGDDSQSIYSFRGANFKNIMQFPEIFSNCSIIKLEENYRSVQPILNFTNAIIENAVEKYSKKLFSNIEGDEKPCFVKSKDNIEQAKFICNRILELRDNGIALNNIAVLFRSSYHSNELEIELNSRNIPYIKYGGIKFAETAHIKDIISFLRIVINPKDELALSRILLLIDGVGNKTAERIIDLIVKNNNGLESLISEENKSKKFYLELVSIYNIYKRINSDKTTVSEMIKIIMKYYSIVLKNNYDNYHKRINDIETLIKIAEKYDNVESFLTDMVLEPPNNSQNKVTESTKDDEFLTLSTIHSAKGLEWHTVFVINLVDGLFPSTKSIESFESIEEERRLFYVASTRAKKKLFLSTPNFVSIDFSTFFSPDRFSFSEKSRFLTEIDNFTELTNELSFEAEKELEDYTEKNKSLQKNYKSRFNEIKNFFD